jgi:hypothetical protein
MASLTRQYSAEETNDPTYLLNLPRPKWIHVDFIRGSNKNVMPDPARANNRLSLLTFDPNPYLITRCKFVGIPLQACFTVGQGTEAAHIIPL